MWKHAFLTIFAALSMRPLPATLSTECDDLSLRTVGVLEVSGFKKKSGSAGFLSNSDPITSWTSSSFRGSVAANYPMHTH